MRLALTFALGLFGLNISCGAEFAEAPPVAAEPVLVTVVTADHVVAISGPDTFTVADRFGNVVAENVTRSELRAEAPLIYELLERAVAGESSIEHGPVLWAGM